HRGPFRNRAEYVRARACTHKSAFCKRGSVNVGFTPKAAEVLRCRELTRCAVTGLTHCSKPGARLQRLFDHLVGRGQARSPGSRGRAQALFRAAPQYRLCNFRLSLPLELTISERWYSLRHVRRYDLGKECAADVGFGTIRLADEGRSVMGGLFSFRMCASVLGSDRI